MLNLIAVMWWRIFVPCFHCWYLYCDGRWWMAVQQLRADE